MSGDATVSVSDLGNGDRAREDDALALVIAWSAAEPRRVGEVAFFEDGGSARVLGRGAEDGPSTEAVTFHRQRPGTLVAGPPLEGPGISRKQLGLRAKGGMLFVERLGRCPLFVNGEAVERTTVVPGDTILLRAQLLLYCTTRARQMPALRDLSAEVLGAPTEPDQLGILGESPAVWRLREQLGFAAKTRGHVLLLGESGTGKELAALALHALSSRAKRRFVARNAATFPSELVDAELFGNVKGYPNPGMAERPGLVGEADGGTLFLDEIGDLAPDLQVHLLRVLDRDGEYQRLGEATTRRADIRLVAATNRDLGALRPDLLARYKIRIALPNLDARREDIPLLVRHLLARAAAESPALLARFAGDDGRHRIDPTLLEHLLRRPYAANVRELEALIWTAIANSAGDQLALSDEVVAPWSVVEPAAAPPPEGDKELTADVVRACIEQHEGNLSRAAQTLGLPNRYALYRLLKKHGIDVHALRK